MYLTIRSHAKRENSQELAKKRKKEIYKKDKIFKGLAQAKSYKLFVCSAKNKTMDIKNQKRDKKTFITNKNTFRDTYAVKKFQRTSLNG